MAVPPRQKLAALHDGLSVHGPRSWRRREAGSDLGSLAGPPVRPGWSPDPSTIGLGTAIRGRSTRFPAGTSRLGTVAFPGVAPRPVTLLASSSSRGGPGGHRWWATRGASSRWRRCPPRRDGPSVEAGPARASRAGWHGRRLLPLQGKQRQQASGPAVLKHRLGVAVAVLKHCVGVACASCRWQRPP